MKKTTIISNSVIDNSLSHLRDKNTSPSSFRTHADTISTGFGHELAKILLPSPVTREIETPLMKTSANFVDSKNFLFVAILRSGYPLCKGIQSAFPDANLALIDIKRDEKTAIPKLNYDGLPDNIDQYDRIIIPDPMLATGGSICMAIDMLKTRGVKIKDITCASIISAPEGINEINRRYPDINIFTCAIDSGLTAIKYIYPGLGDFGDRYYGDINPLIHDDLLHQSLQYQSNGRFQIIPEEFK